jgi:RimJ/RimL family protein N-acetyltransferase
MSWPPAVTLEGDRVRVAPLGLEHHDALVEVVRDGELWNLWYTKVPRAEGVRAEIERRLSLRASGSMQPFVIIDKSADTIVGATTFMNIDADHRRLEIGSTWYAQSAQRTGLNTECKFLLLQHAFEQLDCIAVEFRTHFFNQQSRRAIERLGAKLDGILRSHARLADGSLRDTCVYSITAAEWPAVKAHLQWQMRKPRL